VRLWIVEATGSRFGRESIGLLFVGEADWVGKDGGETGVPWVHAEGKSAGVKAAPVAGSQEVNVGYFGD
jgi:hypothetical protein